MYVKKSIVFFCYSCSLWLFMSAWAQSAFEKLSDITVYAQTLPKLPKNDAPSVYEHNYKRFHTSLQPSFFDRIFYTIGLKTLPLPIDYFEKTIYNVTFNRELNGLIGDFVQKVPITYETSWYVLGPLHGAFHSLVRVLNELKKKGVIDDDLQLKIGHYLVFNGNIASYSPYLLETLMLLLKLMEKNPKNVFVLKGAHEQNWKAFNLKEELAIRSEKSILENKITRLFNTLPLAIYIIGSQQEILRISFYDDHPLLDGDYLKDFFKDDQVSVFKLNGKQPTKKIPIDALIKGYDTTEDIQNKRERKFAVFPMSYKKRDTLHIWTLFSSPITLFNSIYAFNVDSFIVLDLGVFFANWKIDLLVQDIAKKRGFDRVRSFNIATGQELDTATPEKHMQRLKDKITYEKQKQTILLEGCPSGVQEQAVESIQDKEKTLVVED